MPLKTKNYKKFISLIMLLGIVFVFSPQLHATPVTASDATLEEEFRINDVPFRCIHGAAKRYFVPLPLIISILLTENGRQGSASPNKNGTYDYGPMQINTIWLKEIKRYGYTQAMIQHDPCANVEVAAWILSQAMANGKDIWNGVGNYHSYTSQKNARYASHVRKKYFTLLKELQ